MNKKIIYTLFVLLFTFDLSAQLVINELSQGSGSDEYVELIVMGTKTCTDSTVNLQGWIIDDNCGFYGGDGIAEGHYRFSTDPQWAAVPYGTIIVLYNDDDIYPGIVADETDANNDNVYFLPSNTSLLETNSSTPSGGSAITTYTTTGYSAGGDDWVRLGMRNGGDVFQTVSPTVLNDAYHAVGWGNMAGMDIGFAGSASGLVFQNENITDTDPYLQTNWTSQAQINGTPGVGNSIANIAWITSMRIPATNCDFCIDNATFWVKGDTGTLNGVVNVSSGTVTEWINQVPNLLVPSVNANGTPQLTQNLAAFNFNSAMFFQNNSFVKTTLLNDAVLDPNQGSMFVVSTTAALSFNFAVDGPSTGTCGGGRCSSGYRSNRSQYASANNLFVGTTNASIANVISMTANDLTSEHFNSINGVESIGSAVNPIPSQTVPYSLSIGRWPGYSMNNQYIAEAMAFNRQLTQTETYQVESYLAIKYGVSIAHSYYNSTNAGIWNVGNGYDNNIAGIERDDCFGLQQIKSKNVHPGSSVTVALTDNAGTYINPNNFTNDLSSLTWGNNNGNLNFVCSANTPTGYNQLLQRNWLTNVAGTVGNVSMGIDLTAYNGVDLSSVALVIDTDQDGVYSDEIAILPSSTIANEIFFDNISLTDSVFFSLIQNNNLDTILNETICDGDSFFFDNQYLHLLGLYQDTIVTVSGCDSIITLNLNVQICTDCTMDLGNDTLICGPVNMVLDAGIFDEYLWQDGSTNQTFTASSLGDFWCQGSNFDTTNLVVNSGFESGNVNFSTDYIVGTGGTWGQLSNAGTYAVSTSPSLVHNNFHVCSDQTTGTGNMMIVNGSNTANQAVWCQTISVSPNTEYYFSIWAMSVENTNATNVASLYFELNGTQIGTNFSPSFPSCDWQEYTQNWNSGVNTTVDLCIYNHTITGNNDFAIDDIFFGELCTVSDTINITNTPVNPILDTINVCFNDSALIFGEYKTVSGNFRDTIIASSGCDSLYLETEFFVGDSLFSNLDTAICYSDSIFLENAWQNTSNLYIDTLQTANACDSLIFTNLTVFAAPTSDTAIVCSNNPLSVGTVIIDTIPNYIACDSVYNYQTTVFVSLDSSFSISCTNNSALANVTIDTFRTALLCDSFYAFITVTYLPPVDVIIIDSCTNIAVNALSFIDTIPTYMGCDSVYQYNDVRFIQRDTLPLANLCTNDVSQEIINYVHTPSIHGCDSFTTAQQVVYVNPYDSVLDPIEICNNESEIIFGVNQSQSGVYENPILSEGNCDSITYVQELIVNPLPSVFAGNDTTIEIEESVFIQATGAQTYSWNSGETNSTFNITPEETFNYIVLGTDSNNCTSYDSILVIVLVPEINIYLPTGFSPNGDGVNDFFRIINEEDFEDISFSVFNRWGEEIFRSSKNYKFWDGTYKNTPQPIDSYIYKIEATAKKNQQKFDVSGSISLIR